MERPANKQIIKTGDKYVLVFVFCALARSLVVASQCRWHRQPGGVLYFAFRNLVFWLSLHGGIVEWCSLPVRCVVIFTDTVWLLGYRTPRRHLLLELRPRGARFTNKLENMSLVLRERRRWNPFTALSSCMARINHLIKYFRLKAKR